ncbi:MAG: chloride channel protein [Trueperaceae bacterium]|nr:chloride channel protein [Trueperaceae bacterium]
MAGARAPGSWLGRAAGVVRRLGATSVGGASSDTLSLVASAILVGSMAGLAAVGFDRLVHGVGELVHLARGHLGLVPAALLTVLTPAVGGLLVAPIVVRWAPDTRGSGVPHVMVAVSNLGGRVSRRLLFWRPLATALSVGTGASLGSEGPVVQMGASIASLFSSWFRLNDERRRNLAAVAAAGAIAATFNAPIAGALFALEEVLGKFEGRNFSSVVIGAVSATAVSRSMLGDAPAFSVPDVYVLGSPLELPLYLALGLLAAVLAVATIRVLVGSEDLLNRWQVNPWFRPALGGLAVGLLALALPEVLGRGYATIGGVLNEDLGAPVLLAGLLVGKILATGASIGSWGSGGILAPTLMIGASFGALFGSAARELFPALAIRPGAFALVGMAAVFAGVTRAPMSSIVMVFELSGSYQMILPLLLAAVIATLAADLMHTDSYYEMMLARRGLNLIRARDTDLLQTVTVAEVMGRDVPTVAAEDTVRDLADALVASHDHGFVVTPRAEPERMVGIVTLTDLERARREELPDTTPIHEICQCDVQCAHPEEPASAVLERMAALGIGRMPVVRPEAPDRPIGLVKQSDLARAYYLALRRERSHDELQGRLRLRDLTGQEIVEVKVPRGARLAGTSLREARLPQDTIVVAIRRGTRTLFPHGETTLEPDDTVVANVAPGFGPSFRALISELGERPHPEGGARTDG